MKILKRATLNELVKSAGIVVEVGKTVIPFNAHITGRRDVDTKFGPAIVMKGRFSFIVPTPDGKGEKVQSASFLCGQLSDLWDGKSETQIRGEFKAGASDKYKYTWDIYADECDEDPVFDILSKTQLAAATPAKQIAAPAEVPPNAEPEKQSKKSHK